MKPWRCAKLAAAQAAALEQQQKAAALPALTGELSTLKSQVGEWGSIYFVPSQIIAHVLLMVRGPNEHHGKVAAPPLPQLRGGLFTLIRGLNVYPLERV